MHIHSFLGVFLCGAGLMNPGAELTPGRSFLSAAQCQAQQKPDLELCTALKQESNNQEPKDAGSGLPGKSSASNKH